MIVVKLEMWPHGDESKAYPIGEVRIVNDGTGTAVVGNYNVEVMKCPHIAKTPGVWKKGKVEAFNRVKLGPYDLLFLALAKAGMLLRNLAALPLLQPTATKPKTPTETPR